MVHVSPRIKNVCCVGAGYVVRIFSPFATGETSPSRDSSCGHEKSRMSELLTKIINRVLLAVPS